MTDAKPYSDDHVPTVRSLIESGEVLPNEWAARLLATLDERARERDDFRERLRTKIDDVTKALAEAGAPKRVPGFSSNGGTYELGHVDQIAWLAQRLHEARVAADVLDNRCSTLGSSCQKECARANAARAEAAALREEVARLREADAGDVRRAQSLELLRQAIDRARGFDSFAEDESRAGFVLVMKDDLDRSTVSRGAAERRAEEAEGHLRLVTTYTPSAHIEIERREAARAWLATHPPQQQAPAETCRCGHPTVDHNGGGCCTWHGCRCARVSNVRPAPSPSGAPEALGEPGPCGHEVTSPAPWCEECVRGGAPEGEDAHPDDDKSLHCHTCAGIGSADPHGYDCPRCGGSGVDPDAADDANPGKWERGDRIAPDEDHERWIDLDRVTADSLDGCDAAGGDAHLAVEDAVAYRWVRIRRAADDDADPSAWDPGDGYLTRDGEEGTWTDQQWVSHEAIALAREFGWRRVRRTGEERRG